MTARKKRIVIIAIVLLVALAGVGGYVCYMQWRVGNAIGQALGKAFAKEFIKQLTGPLALREVDTAAWARVHVGMTQQKVIQILGDAPSKRKTDPSQASTKQDLDRFEFWEYNYSYGFSASVPHPRAYVIYFDQDGKVASLGVPTQETDTAKTDAK